jgi:histone chaperone ASF1
LTCAYDGREFVRVGYYVNNEYDSEELNADPPAKPILERVRRNVLAEKPRVTRFAIKWSVYLATHVCSNHILIFHRDSEESAPAEFPPDQPEADEVEADGDTYGAEEADEEDDEDAVEAEGELAEGEAKAEVEDDDAMADVEGEDAGDQSEDLEGESSGEEDEEDLEEEEGEEAAGEDADDAMMDVDEQKPANGAAANGDAVMAH